MTDNPTPEAGEDLLEQVRRDRLLREGDDLVRRILAEDDAVTMRVLDDPDVRRADDLHGRVVGEQLDRHLPVLHETDDGRPFRGSVQFQNRPVTADEVEGPYTGRMDAYAQLRDVATLAELVNTPLRAQDTIEDGVDL